MRISEYWKDRYSSRIEKKAIKQACGVTSSDIRNVLKHRASSVTINGNKDFYLTRMPLRGFKKLIGGKIANLIIPRDTLIYWDPCSGKMRGSKAYVHSIWDPDTREFASSGYSCRGFLIYETKKWVAPEYGFAHEPESCAGGIHFYLGLKEALEY